VTNELPIIFYPADIISIHVGAPSGTAEIDGCSHPWHVILPMTTPALATIVIYNFIHIWKEFVFALHRRK
jgi:hypothetical protein